MSADLQRALVDYIAPALGLLPPVMSTPGAEIVLLTIGLQESRWLATHQVGGPAHGYLQFEQGGGVRGVLTHKASASMARAISRERGVEPTEASVFAAIEHDPVLAVALGRLLLWTDPKPLPALGDAAGAWTLYLRVWRPGAYQRDPDGLQAKWSRNYAAAMNCLESMV